MLWLYVHICIAINVTAIEDNFLFPFMPSAFAKVTVEMIYLATLHFSQLTVKEDHLYETNKEEAAAAAEREIGE
jgi:hypothetical protein